MDAYSKLHAARPYCTPMDTVLVEEDMYKTRNSEEIVTNGCLRVKKK